MRDDSVNPEQYDAGKIAIQDELNTMMEGHRARERVADVVRNEFKDEPLAYVADNGKVVLDESLVADVSRKTAEKYGEQYAEELASGDFSDRDREFIRRELAEDIPEEQIRRFEGEHFVLAGEKEGKEETGGTVSVPGPVKMGLAGVAAAAVIPVAAAADEPADSGPQMDHQGMSELQGQVEDVKSNMYDFPGSYTRMDLGENRELDLDVQREEPKFQDIEENLYKFPGKYTRMDLGQEKEFDIDVPEKKKFDLPEYDREFVDVEENLYKFPGKYTRMDLGEDRPVLPEKYRDETGKKNTTGLIQQIQRFLDSLTVDVERDRNQTVRSNMYDYPGSYTRMDLGPEEIDIEPEKREIRTE